MSAPAVELKLVPGSQGSTPHPQVLFQTFISLPSFSLSQGNLSLLECNLRCYIFVLLIQTVNQNPKRGRGNKGEREKALVKDCMTYTLMQFCPCMQLHAEMQLVCLTMYTSIPQSSYSTPAMETVVMEGSPAHVGPEASSKKRSHECCVVVLLQKACPQINPQLPIYRTYEPHSECSLLSIIKCINIIIVATWRSVHHLIIYSINMPIIPHSREWCRVLWFPRCRKWISPSCCCHISESHVSTCPLSHTSPSTARPITPPNPPPGSGRNQGGLLRPTSFWFPFLTLLRPIRWAAYRGTLKERIRSLLSTPLFIGDFMGNFELQDGKSKKGIDVQILGKGRSEYLCRIPRAGEGYVK